MCVMVVECLDEYDVSLIRSRESVDVDVTRSGSRVSACEKLLRKMDATDLDILIEEATARRAALAGS
jgi:hypothetical protein